MSGLSSNYVALNFIRYRYCYKLNFPNIKMKQSFPLHQLVILIILIILFVITFSLYFIKPVQINEEISNNTVIRIIDGDTFEIYSGDKVRLIPLSLLIFFIKKQHMEVFNIIVFRNKDCLTISVN